MTKIEALYHLLLGTTLLVSNTCFSMEPPADFSELFCPEILEPESPLKIPRTVYCSRATKPVWDKKRTRALQDRQVADEPACPPAAKKALCVSEGDSEHQENSHWHQQKLLQQELLPLQHNAQRICQRVKNLKNMYDALAWHPENKPAYPYDYFIAFMFQCQTLKERSIKHPFVYQQLEELEQSIQTSWNLFYKKLFPEKQTPAPKLIKTPLDKFYEIFPAKKSLIREAIYRFRNRPEHTKSDERYFAKVSALCKNILQQTEELSLPTPGNEIKDLDQALRSSYWMLSTRPRLHFMPLSIPPLPDHRLKVLKEMR